VNHDRLRESVKRHEGYRNIPYRDHLGNWTVGTGHLIHRIDLVNMANYRTVGNLLDFLTDPAQHQRWLESDLLEAESDARRFLGDAWDRLSDARREVLTEMAFQLGEKRLGGFLKFRDAVLSGMWGVASAEMLDSLWAKQTPGRVAELAARMRAG
jgi:lysozyme